MAPGTPNFVRTRHPTRNFQQKQKTSSMKIISSKWTPYESNFIK